MRRGGIPPPPPVLAPGSALGSRPRVALSSAQVASVYRRTLGPGKGSLLGPGSPPRVDRHPFARPRRPRSPPRPAEFRAGMVSATRCRGRSGPRFLGHAWAAEGLMDLLPRGGDPLGRHGCLPEKQRHDQTRSFSSRSSISRYCCTRATLHFIAWAVCCGVSLSRRQSRTRSYWLR